tara:strand:+ start:8573 stop:9472 length:900 start_codon:yes stop_codon:yes gene_type:complete
MDYYQILGVHPGASDVEIKKRYYKLAKEYHPDKTKGDEEKAKHFLKIQEAYSSLTKNVINEFDLDDEILKQFSDMFGFSFQETGVNHREVNDTYDVEISIEEYLKGASKTIKVSSTSVCEVCLGTGVKDHHVNTHVCAACQGTGFDFNIPIFTCSVCRGKRFCVANNKPCDICKGEGLHTQYSDVPLIIPRLTQNGHVIIKDGNKFTIKHTFGNEIVNGRVVISQYISIVKWLCGGHIVVDIPDGERIRFESSGAFDLGRRYTVSNDVIVEFKLLINSKHINILKRLNPVFKNIFQSNT